MLHQGDENTSNDSIGQPLAESTPQKDGNQAVSAHLEAAGTTQSPNSIQNGNGSNVPTGQLVDIPLSETPDQSLYEVSEKTLH